MLQWKAVLGRLLLLFTIVPLVEVYLLVTLGGLMGPAATVALVVVTGALGAALARREGTRVWREWQEAIAAGEMPEEGVVSSLLVLVGGVLLVTPGVLTDIVGLSLLIPPSRRAIAAVVKRRAQSRMEIQTIEMRDLGPAAYFGPEVFSGMHDDAGRPRPDTTSDRRSPAGGEIIDVEAEPSGDGRT